MRIVFMGTPDFSVPVLDALLAAGHEIAAVYCQPPRPAGRGKRARPSPVEVRARARGLPVRHPVNFKDANEVADFAALGADVAVVVAYGLILPQAVLDAPMRGCLNIHASLLPRWRGAAPIQRAIMAGDDVSGVSIMQMDAGLDTGPVLLVRKTPVLASDTAATLHDRLSETGAGAIVEALARLEHLTAVPQAQEGVTYAAKIDKAEARIDWSAPASEVDRKIRGLSPFPGAWCLIGGDRVKVLDSSGSSGTAAEAKPGVVLGAARGEVHDGALTVACGQGAVRLTRMQRAGKGAMDAAAFLRGTPLKPGTRLE